MSGTVRSFKEWVQKLDLGLTGESLLDGVILFALLGACALAAIQSVAYRSGVNIFTRKFHLGVAFPMGAVSVAVPLWASDVSRAWMAVAGLAGGVVFQLSMVLSQVAVLKRVGSTLKEARQSGEFPTRYVLSIREKRTSRKKLHS